MTDEEKKKKAKYDWYSAHKYEYYPSGKLILMLEDLYGIRCKFADGKQQKLENCLALFVAGLSIAAEKKKQDRKEAEIREKEWEEECQLRQEAETRRIEEQGKIERLRKLIDAWHESQRIRTFLEAVQNTFQSRGQTIGHGSELGIWLDWASKYANRIDPMTEA